MNRLLYAVCGDVRGNARNNVAIQGYDVVACFTDGKAVPGRQSISAESRTWNGDRRAFIERADRNWPAVLANLTRK